MDGVDRRTGKRLSMSRGAIAMRRLRARRKRESRYISQEIEATGPQFITTSQMIEDYATLHGEKFSIARWLVNLPPIK